MSVISGIPFFKNAASSVKISSEMSVWLDTKFPSETREKFHIPVDKHGNTSTYMNGNSLGCQPKKAQEYSEKVFKDWAKTGLGMHFDGAFLPAVKCDLYTQDGFGKLVGAKNPEVEVVAMNGLSVNLHLFLSSFYRPAGNKTKILLEKGAFPSDHYAVRSQVKLSGNDEDLHTILLEPKNGKRYLETVDIINSIRENAEDLALILLPGIQYFTGQFFQIKEITAVANELNIPIGWDLAHAVGNVPMELHDWGVDFAVWCSYKYVNSGAGGIGGAFLHEKHSNNFDRPRMYGWWGHKLETRFLMDNNLDSEAGVLSYRLCNPPPLLVAPLYASLEIFEGTSMEEIRARSLLLTSYLEHLVDNLFDKSVVEIVTPRDVEQRGAQLSLKINFGDKSIQEVEDELVEQGILCDTRHDIVRIAPAPLYNTFQDVWTVTSAISKIVNPK